mgnify:CR=1 FL=1
MKTNQWDKDIEKGIIDEKEINNWDKYTGGYCARTEVKTNKGLIRHKTVSELLKEKGK